MPPGRSRAPQATGFVASPDSASLPLRLTESRFGNYRQPTELPFGMARTRIPAEERRVRILDAAVEVFAELGYDAAKMQNIAARAGVVPSVLYDHFGSK